MKTLTECLTESLKESCIINEAGNQWVVCFDHEDPDNTYIISNCSQSDIKKLNQTSFDQMEYIPTPKGLVFMDHNDESCNITDLGYTDINQLKNALWKEFQLHKGEIEDDGAIEDLELEAFGFFALNFEHADKFKNANDLWKPIENMIKYSTIDGDSSAAYAIIDPKKKTEVCVGGMTITYFDSFKEFWSMMFDGNEE